MRGQTSSRAGQVYSYKCHKFVNNIVAVLTTSVYVKYITGRKIICKNLPQKDIKENIITDYLKEYVIWYLTSSKGDWLPPLV